MGRLDTEKAVDQTIRAFAALSADSPAHLTILGDGPCRRDLEALSRRLGQDRRIAFPGAVGDVAPYLSRPMSTCPRRCRRACPMRCWRR